MCRAAFISEVFDFRGQFCAWPTNNARIAMFKKKKKKSVHQPGKIFIFLKNENALLFTKVPIRPTKTGGSYVSVFDL